MQENANITKNQIRFGSRPTNRNYIKEIGVYSPTQQELRTRNV